jgi:hypothetical protein
MAAARTVCLKLIIEKNGNQPEATTEAIELNNKAEEPSPEQQKLCPSPQKPKIQPPPPSIAVNESRYY